MSSAYKNAVKRKTHKERAQPASRRKYGLLEKKKDYLLRARDFHKKEKTLQGLRRKAEERNPDEFYFAMEKARTKDGVHVQRTSEANKYSQEELRLMKTQDAAYVRLKAQTDAKKAERLQESLHYIGAPPPQRRHVVFVDSEAERRDFDAAQHFDTAPELLGRAFNRPRREQLEAGPLAVAGGAANPGRAVAKAERQRASSYRELAQRYERGAKLEGLAAKMDLERALMGKGRRRKQKVTVDGETRIVYRWKQERKR